MSRSPRTAHDNGLGRIEDEGFTLEVLNDDGDVAATFTGTADEHATAEGVLSEDEQELLHSIYSFVAMATSESGSTLRLGRHRADRRTGEVRRFDYAIQSWCVD